MNEPNNVVILLLPVMKSKIEDDRWGKSLPYQASIGVPLVIAGPDVESGIVTDTPVSLIDLTATFLDQSSSEIPSQLNGSTLRTILAGHNQVHRQYVLSGLDDWRLIYDGRYKLIQNFDEKSWLFDLKTDPAETKNLFNDAPEQEQVDKLQSFLMCEIA